MSFSKKTSYILMVILIVIWGLDFISAKIALDVINPFTLVFIKYSLALIIIFVLKQAKEKESKLNLKDIPAFIVCSLLGMIGYYGLEYNAMSYISVSVLSIILATMPVASILTEAVFYKKKITIIMIVGAFISLLGVVIIIGADFKDLFEGKILGYLLAFGAMISWNIYNFSTGKLHEKYAGISLSYYQMLISIIILSPYALTHLPAIGEISMETIGWVLFQGIICTGIGYLIYINALNKIGITPTALFSNFLPIITVILDWLIIGEKISFMHIIGGILVVISACVVIFEEDKVNKQLAEREFLDGK